MATAWRCAHAEQTLDVFYSAVELGYRIDQMIDSGEQPCFRVLRRLDCAIVVRAGIHFDVLP
jgi:hypothetical protein